MPNIGEGADSQIQEIKESVELPLIILNIMKMVFIILRKGSFSMVHLAQVKPFGSELIQKYLEHAPSILFIDEIDAIETKRCNSNSGGEREIQRTMLELLNQLDGLDSREDVNVIMLTNQIGTLDPALIRPARTDKKIEFHLPDGKTKKHIFQIHTSRMTLADEVTLDDLIMAKDDLSGADIQAICTEAGLMALRECRMKVTNENFKKSGKHP
ncbi:26S proteasome regulatory subunit 4 [Plecturocebus cupreus]